MGENARRDGWHFKSADRFARLNKSNGAHPCVESRREEKEIYEERSKKDGRRTTGRSERKGGQCRSSHWPWHSESWLLLLRAFLEKKALRRAERESEFIATFLAWGSLVNLYSFLPARREKSHDDTRRCRSSAPTCSSLWTLNHREEPYCIQESDFYITDK